MSAQSNNTTRGDTEEQRGRRTVEARPGSLLVIDTVIDNELPIDEHPPASNERDAKLERSSLFSDNVTGDGDIEVFGQTCQWQNVSDKAG